MRIGCLGNIVFQVSDRRIRTISSLSQSGSATYAMHQRVLGKELPEYTGSATEKIDLEIFLSSYLGAKPQMELRKIRRAVNGGQVLPLVIGNHYYGQYVISSYSADAVTFDGELGVSACSAKVSLMEYPRS